MPHAIAARSATTTTASRPAARRHLARALLGLFGVVAVLALSAGPALAQGTGGQDIQELKSRVSDRRIGVGNVTVAEGESIDTEVVAIDGSAFVDGSTTEGVFVVSGDAVITGKVGGTVIVIDGNAKISGQVGNDVVVLRGRAIIQDGAVIKGDVRSSDEHRVASGAKVTGEVKTLDATGFFTALGFTILGLIWLAVTVSTAIFGVVLLALFRHPLEASAATERTSAGKSIGWGLLLWIGLPAITTVAVFSFVGIPLGIGTGGAIGIIGALGYITSALCLGRLMIKRPRNVFGAFFAGWAILRVLALLPGIGILVWVGASVWGMGALAVTGWRASRTPKSDGPAPESESTTEPAVVAASTAAVADTTASTSATESTTDAATEPTPAKKAPAKKAPAKKTPAKSTDAPPKDASAGGSDTEAG